MVPSVVLLGLLGPLAAPPADPVPLTAEVLVARVRGLVLDGIELEGLRRGYNLVAAKVLQRHPQLRDVAAAAGVPEAFASWEDLAAELFHLADAVEPAIGGLSAQEKEEAMALAAGWLRRGRIILPEAARWHCRRDPWRKRTPPDARELARFRAALAAPALARLAGLLRPGRPGESAGRASGLEPEAGAFAPLRIDAALLRTAVAFAEDFLRSYEEDAAPCPAASAEEWLGLLAAGVARPGEAAAASFAAARPDPLVVRGLERLFADLSREVLGLDPLSTARAVEALERDGGLVAAFSGYGVRAGEPFGLPFQLAVTDYLWALRGARGRLVWLREQADLDALLADPTVRRLVLVGHGSMEGYGYEGLTGPPEETIARCLAWAKARAGELAPRLQSLVEEGDPRPIRAFLEDELSLGWRGWGYEDFARLAARPGFQAKDEIVLYACSVDELEVRGVPEGFREALFAEIGASSDAASWLELRRAGSSWLFEAVDPSTGESFRDAIPGFLAAVQRRLGRPLDVEVKRDWVKLLARRSGRFAGTAWVGDYAAWPSGQTWSEQDLAARVREALGGASRTRGDPPR
ncbi:MAG: hypothetical protein HY721_26110 [Planctomycetes bacterium]|nr:hypothetical protein [Planctomycetota bacterium]